MTERTRKRRERPAHIDGHMGEFQRLIDTFFADPAYRIRELNMDLDGLLARMEGAA